MKVIVNNFEAEKDMDKATPPDFPRQENCEHCNSLIELNKGDTYIGQYGCVKWDCPCCGETNTIDALDGEELTPSHFHYPQHFSTYGDNDDSVHQTDEQIENHIKDLIKRIRESKESGDPDPVQYTQTSDTLILVDDYGDEYSVLVAKNYQDTYLQYEAEDYV